MKRHWKTLIVILVLATAAPAAVILARAVGDTGALGGGTNGGGQPGSGGEFVLPTEAPLFCRGRGEFQISGTSLESSAECCTVAVVGEIRNTCNHRLSATVAAALRSVGGRIVAVGNSETSVGSIGPGDSTFFRVDFSGPSGWDNAQRRDVVIRVTARVVESP